MRDLVDGLFVTNRRAIEFLEDSCRSIVSTENKGRGCEFPEVTECGDEFLMTTVVLRMNYYSPPFKSVLPTPWKKSVSPENRTLSNRKHMPPIV